MKQHQFSALQRLHESLQEATNSGLLDVLAGSAHPDAINDMCDGITALLANPGQLEPDDPDQSGNHEVWIQWGTSGVNVSHYEFPTLSELNAFLTGVSDAVGYLDHKQFDTEEELQDFLAAEAAEDSESDACDA
jgi:hypothetical protein